MKETKNYNTSKYEGKNTRKTVEAFFGKKKLLL